MRLVLKIILYQNLHCFCCITGENDDISLKIAGNVEDFSICNGDIQQRLSGMSLYKKKHVFITANALYLKAFLMELEISLNFRRGFARNMTKKLEIDSIKRDIDRDNCLKIKFVPPKQEIVDYKWNWHITQQIYYSRESENVVSWLSTLGGGFSCVGDYNANCAVAALRISRCQYRVGVLSGDRALMVRALLWGNFARVQLAVNQLHGAAKFEAVSHLKNNVHKLLRKAIKMKDREFKKMCEGVINRMDYILKTCSQLELRY